MCLISFAKARNDIAKDSRVLNLMCGIVGSWARKSGCNCPVREMLSCIGHRGPDAEGVWVDKDLGIALGHARLSILDLSEAGAQPMLSPSGRYVIVFNGEIYNHLEIRKTLDQSVSTSWRGHSDTETLLTAIEHWGFEKTLERCVGMFAISLWDREQKSLSLARDRFGEKPLYYLLKDAGFAFASELKALRQIPGFSPSVDLDALNLLLHDGYISAPYTIYKDVYKLLPGHILKIGRDDLAAGGVPAAIPYWDARIVADQCCSSPFDGDVEDAIDGLTRHLQRAVKDQMLADVPLGAFLSGGVDSSLVVALMQSHSKSPIKTFSIGFMDPAYDESGYAADVARYLGTDHTTHIVTPEEALAVIPHLPKVYDEPFADVSAIPTCILAKVARQQVAVSLSGDAGDELFAGYNRYLGAGKTWRRLSGVPLSLRRAFASGIQLMPPSGWDSFANSAQAVLPKRMHYKAVGNKLHRLAGAASATTPQEFYELITAKWPAPEQVIKHSARAAGPGQKILSESRELTLEAMTLADTVQYLPDDILVKVDRAAMAVSLETRVPMLDHRVAEFAWSLPMSMKVRDGSGKWILKKVLGQYVPSSLIDRPKMGFDVPIDRWLRGPLRDWAEALLDPVLLNQQGFFDAAVVRQIWIEHLSGKGTHHQKLWPILMFQAWHKEWMH